MSFKQVTWAMNRTGVRAIEKLVLIILADRSDKEGWSFYSQDTIAKRCGCTRKTAREALKGLEDAGLIRRMQRSIGALRTSDHIQIGPSYRWVKTTQTPGSKLPTIPTTPYGVSKKKKDSAAGEGLRVINGGRQ